MDQPPSLSILSDQPADEDRLNFYPYARTLAEIAADPGTDTPLTIGVFGGWGQGKTSLMRMVERMLGDRADDHFALRTAWFNAWLYHQQLSLWRALISCVLAEVIGFPTLDEGARARLRRLEARLYGVQGAAGGHLTLPAGALPGLRDAALPPLVGLELLRRQARRDGEQEAAARLEVLIADVEESEAAGRRDQIAALDDFRRQLERISRECIVPHGRLVVFVDDLDRCLPDKAVEVLEAVKLFLDVPGCVFMLGVAREVVEEGIRVRYRGAYGAAPPEALDGARYLEKIIQLPFSLPPIAPETVSGYVGQIARAGLPDPRCETVFAAGLDPNPRRIKRTLNVFTLLWRLSQNREDLHEAIKPVRLAKIVAIQQLHPRLFALITDGPHLLIDLERRLRERERAGAEGEELRGAGRALPGAGAEGAEGEASAGPLRDFLGQSLLRALLTCTAAGEPDANFADLTPAGVREYIYLTRSITEPTLPDMVSALPFEPQMVTVPAGPFLMGTPESQVEELSKLGVKPEVVRCEVPQHEVNLPEYAISRYPVTNAEYHRFLEDGGYGERDYWTAAGWERKESEGWMQPRFWDEDRFSDPSQPAVGVSWYEAAAYCRWLAAKTERAYRLPSEAEWEKAARGTDGRRYPWGNAWDPARCNNKESGPGHTTPAGQYSPAGDSPYGAGDMVGQVWEWCATRWQDSYEHYQEDDDPEGEEIRVLRGGWWGSRNPAGICRCGARIWYDPWDRNYLRGFRCVRTLSSVP